MLTRLFKRWRRETTPVPLDGRWWIYHVQPPGTTAAEYVVSLLSPDTFKALGHLPVRAILGGYDGSPDGPIEPASFTQNDAFIDLLHSIIQTCAPTATGFQDAARQQGEGWVYVLDARTPDPTGRVPMEDILGAFEVHDGVAVPESYWRNREHLLLSERGFFTLLPELHERLLDACMQPD
jgi:hypothetical protein